MAANNNFIKIYLIEQQKIVREGIKVLLEEEQDFKVFNSSSKDVKISSINNLQPDILLISLDNLDENDFSYLNIFDGLNNDYLNKNLDAANQYLQKIQNSSAPPQTVELKAPFMGVVEEIDSDPRAVLDEKQTVVRLLDCQNLWVETVVDSQAIEKIKLDSSVLVKLENYPNDISGNIVFY